MSEQDNLSTNEALGAAINSGNLTELHQIFAPTVIDHDPAPDQGPGPEGFISFFTMMRTAFPDLKMSPERVVSNPTDVSMAYTITGTHQGDFLGIAATGKQVSVRGVQIARFEGGKIVERWGSSDEMGLVKQLGGSVGGKGLFGKLADQIAAS